jgi:lipoprotein-anchoring transpeptidase ErfK/SrfK
VRRGLVAALFVLGFGLAGGFSATVVAAVTGTTATGTTATSTTPTDTSPTTPPPVKAPRIAPRVSIGGIPVGRMTSVGAEALVRKAFVRRLRLTVAGDRYAPRPWRFGAVARVRLAVARAMSADEGTAVPLVVTVQGAKVRTFVAALATRFDREPADAALSLVHDRPYLTKEVDGRALRRNDAVLAIVQSLVQNTRTRLVLRFDKQAASVTRSDFGPLIVIHRGENRLDLYDGVRLVREFGVATGQAIYPTPLGRFTIVVKWVNPWWYPPNSAWAAGEKPIPPGPGNPLGTRWMGLSSPGVGIHGTPDDASIGYSASHGCIRMHIPDAEWLFRHVEVGTTVYIVAS